VGPANLARLWRRLQQTRVDLLVLFTALPNIWGRVLGRLAGAPLIVGNIRGNTPYRQHERWLWPLADHLVCNNEAVRTRLTAGYRIPPARLSLIYNGVDTDFFRPGALTQAGGRLRVLSVARMVPDKDHATLVRAFQLVAGAHPEAELWMVGEGSRKSAIEGLTARLLPPGRVRFLPGRADLRPLFQEADLLALSSVTEALPNVVLEAMACGLPVVATRVGGLPELVVSGETGWLAPHRDPAALAGAMGQLLADPETRQAFGRAGRERVLQDFSLEAMVRRHADLFARLLNQPGRPPGGGR
jgi:glycosyltransferase involved in cell wall biosynthesis